MMVRRPLPAVVFFGSSVLLAAGTATGLREFRPYEALRRTTPEARFLAWEGAVWMIGLVLLTLGGAILVENIALLKKRSRGDSIAGGLPGRSPSLALLPWWMLATGGALLALGIWARAQPSV